MPQKLEKNHEKKIVNYFFDFAEFFSIFYIKGRFRMQSFITAGHPN